MKKLIIKMGGFTFSQKLTILKDNEIYKELLIPSSMVESRCPEIISNYNIEEVMIIGGNPKLMTRYQKSIQETLATAKYNKTIPIIVV